jgi:Zn-dependent M28 family amino/carboxypeptidase
MTTTTVADRLRTSVRMLAGTIGERNMWRPDALCAAEAFLVGEWRSQGYAVTRHPYSVGGSWWSNIEVERTGRRWPGEIVLLGAHYDSVIGSPGADDNASGVAALLDLSRRFTEIEPERTVRFVAFVNEEPPLFLTEAMGSRVYAAMARRRGDRIALMICLESLGCYRDDPGSQGYPPFLGLCYPTRGCFVACVSNLKSRRALRTLVARFRAHCDFPIEYLSAPALVPGIGWSDHASFWREGYRAVMVTDTAFYRYPWYHTSADLPDRLDYGAMTRVVDGLAESTADLAGR